MKPSEYIQNVVRSESPIFECDPGSARIIHSAMGCATEAGELLDSVKKHIFYGRELDTVNLQEEIGDMEAAKESYNKAVNVNLDESYKWYNKIVTAHSGRGYALLGLGRLEEAFESFDKALKMNPRWEDALVGKAIVQIKQGKINTTGKFIKCLRELKKV